ncbi:cytochrome P450 [Pseudorhodoferax sp.]|uniref:cytochrome P450 n=1 Tax=Pseudorhodoferax sp. TaxID=1993553 RepID=UPI002DD6200D|nr:cytochrome P450 [Pseudorhodoferax sp.]
MTSDVIDAAAVAGFTLARPPDGFIADPYPWYAALRTHSPVHRLGPDSVLLTRHADVLALYRSEHVSSDKRVEFAPKLGAGSPLYEHHTTSLVFNDPPLHTRVRRILMGALNQRAIARMEPGLVTLVADLLDRLADQAAPDLIEHFAAQIPVEVIGNLLDVPHDERGPLREWSLAILSALEPVPGAEVLAHGNQAVSGFLAYLDDLIARRRARPGDPDVDVLTRLMRGDAEGTLSASELMHNCIFLLNAGHETTSNLIGNGMDALLTHRGQLDKLVAEPALINTAVEELLRFESPLQLNNRRCTAAVEVDGHTLPEGSFVTLAIGAANRDPAVFAAPEQLDITRKPNPHLAFGQGAHACSGMNVARLEARIALAALLARHPRIRRAGAAERDMRLRFRGLRHLPVALD